MVEMLLKGAHIGLSMQEEACKKMAGVFEAISRVDYMLWWVVSIFVIDVSLLLI